MASEKDRDIEIHELVESFDRLANMIDEVVCYMRKSEAMVRRTGRMMIVQTILATFVLVALVLMGWMVMKAWTKVEQANESNRVTFDYLLRKFPEDTAELSLVKAEPQAAKSAIEEVDPVPDPDGKRAARAIERRDKVLKKVRDAMPEQKMEQMEQWQVEYQLTPPEKAASDPEE